MYTIKILNFLVGFVILLASFFLLVNYANAGSTGLRIQPVKISHTLEPGDVISDTISLTNAGDEVVEVEVTVEDFIPSAGTTNIQFIGRAEGVTTVRDWIDLDIPESFIFQKGESKNIRYTIRAPAEAEPGSHFGVAFFKATKMSDAGQLKVGTRVGTLIYITIPGDFLQKGRILDFSSPLFVQRGPVSFVIKFENTGTVHFEPKGSIKITNIFGKEIGEVPIAGQAVLPTGVRDLNAQWNVIGLLGRYRATISIVDGEGNVLTTDSITFYAFPIRYAIGWLIAVVAVFFGLRFLKRRVRISISRK